VGQRHAEAVRLRQRAQVGGVVGVAQRRQQLEVRVGGRSDLGRQREQATAHQHPLHACEHRFEGADVDEDIGCHDQPVAPVSVGVSVGRAVGVGVGQPGRQLGVVQRTVAAGGARHVEHRRRHIDAIDRANQRGQRRGALAGSAV